MRAPSTWWPWVVLTLAAGALLLAPAAAHAQCTSLAPPTGYAASCPNGSAVGSTCSISCGVGYQGTATPSSSTCQAGNTWSATTFSGCAAITCPAPTAPTGYALSCGTGTQYYGATCSTSCATGFAGTPTISSIACGNGGLWSPAPSGLSGCAPVDCGLPSAPTGYGLSCPGGTAYGASCTATSCDSASGYVGTATGTKTCQGNGTWSAGSFAGCALVDCGVPVAPTGYALACSSGTKYGASCAAVCSSATGYVGTASSMTTCQANGTWSAALFTGCALAQCGPFSRTGYATSCTGTSYGSTCSIACDVASGYVGAPSASSSTCPLSEFWTPAPATLSGCAVADCGALAPPTGYTATCSGGTAFGATCSFACAAGYTGTPSSASTTCQVLGWSTPPSSLSGCALADCGPLTFAGADVADCSAHSRFGETCAVTCLAGHSGTPAATCTAAGTWSKTGACSALACWPAPDTNGDSCGSGGEVCLSGTCAAPAAGQLCAAPVALDPGGVHTFALDDQHDLLAARRCPGALAAGKDVFVEVLAGGPGCGNGLRVEVDDAAGIDALVVSSCASTSCATLDAEATATTLHALLDPALAGTVLIAVHVRGAPPGATGTVWFNPMCTGATPPSGGGGGGCGAAAPAGVALLWVAAAALARRRRPPRR